MKFKSNLCSSDLDLDHNLVTFILKFDQIWQDLLQYQIRSFCIISFKSYRLNSYTNKHTEGENITFPCMRVVNMFYLGRTISGVHIYTCMCIHMQNTLTHLVLTKLIGLSKERPILGHHAKTHILKSGRFHEIQQISHEIQHEIWHV